MNAINFQRKSNASMANGAIIVKPTPPQVNNVTSENDGVKVDVKDDVDKASNDTGVKSPGSDVVVQSVRINDVVELIDVANDMLTSLSETEVPLVGKRNLNSKFGRFFCSRHSFSH